MSIVPPGWIAGFTRPRAEDAATLEAGRGDLAGLLSRLPGASAMFGETLAALPLVLRVLVGTLMLTPVMVFVFIPLSTRLLAPWLHGRGAPWRVFGACGTSVGRRRYVRFDASRGCPAKGVCSTGAT